MTTVRPRIRVPKTAAAGEIVTIKTLINHEMETGLRRDGDGKIIPRSIINRFTCDFNGVNVLDVAIEPTVSANPFFEFDAKVDVSGEFKLTWYDDNGDVHEASKSIIVA